MTSGRAAAVARSTAVQDAAAQARSAVDELLWQRSLRSKGGQLAAEVRVVNAQASAALDGADLPLAAWQAGSAFDGSPMGLVAHGVWRLECELAQIEPVWRTAPTQALARMHTLVGAGLVDSDQLGRPRTPGVAPDDPMHLGARRIDTSTAPTAVWPAPAAAISALVSGVGTGLRPDRPSGPGPEGIPAVIEAATLHAELIWLRPFAFGNGPIARAAARLVLAMRGLDPNLLVVVDAGVMALGRSAYVRALRAYAGGDDDGAAEWMIFYCGAVSAGGAITNRLLAAL